MNVWPWEVGDDVHRATARDIANAGSVGNRGEAGRVAGASGEDGDQLCRVSSGGAGNGSRRPAPEISEDAAATGAPAVCEDVRPVRVQLSAIDRRAADPRVAHAAVCTRG